MNDIAPSAPVAASPQSLFRVAATRASPGLPIADGDVEHWILNTPQRDERDVEFFDELCWRLVGRRHSAVARDPPYRHLASADPGFAVRWLRDRKVTEEIHIAHGGDQVDEFRQSPIRGTIQRGIPFRRRLDGDLSGYPLLEQVRAGGGTEYFALPLNQFFDRWPVVTWTTDRPGGFTEPHVAMLTQIIPALAAVVDARAARRVSANLLGPISDREASRQVLAGQVRRGEGESLNAVIMATDLRGFTALSDRLDGGEVITLLDDYFDAVASPVHQFRGEVLKFIGDGVLAIFPTGEDWDFTSTSVRALDAALAGLARLDQVNAERHAAGQAEIRIGIGLHLGEVIYGNVGAVDRLDFTVIGPAVNLAARLEGLTKRLMRPLITSQAFAAACPRPSRLARLSPGPRLQRARGGVRTAGLGAS